MSNPYCHPAKGGESPLAFRYMQECNLKLSVVLGNHDRYSTVSRFFASHSRDGKMAYTAVEGPWKRIVVDSSSNQVGEQQRRWLEEELKTDANILLFIHHPVLSVDTPLDKSTVVLRDREEVAGVLRRCNRAIAIFCGHYHVEHVSTENRSSQFVTPAASYHIIQKAGEFRLDAFVFGYRLIRLKGAEIQTEVVMLTR